MTVNSANIFCCSQMTWSLRLLKDKEATKKVVEVIQGENQYFGLKTFTRSPFRQEKPHVAKFSRM